MPSNTHSPNISAEYIDHWGHLSIQVDEPGGLLNGPRAPEREGWECFFVARHGEYTRFSYKAVS